MTTNLMPTTELFFLLSFIKRKQIPPLALYKTKKFINNYDLLDLFQKISKEYRVNFRFYKTFGKEQEDYFSITTDDLNYTKKLGDLNIKIKDLFDYGNVDFTLNKEIKNHISNDIDKYIDAFEIEDYFSKKHYFNLEIHHAIFKDILDQYKDISDNNIRISFSELKKATTYDINLFLGLEYLLLMEKEKYIQIKDVTFSKNYDEFEWVVIIKLLKGREEIYESRNEILSFKDIKVWPKTGKCTIGRKNIKPFRKKNSALFKFLYLLVKDPVTEHSYIDIFNKIYTQKKIDKHKKYYEGEFSSSITWEQRVAELVRQKKSELERKLAIQDTDKIRIISNENETYSLK